MPYGFAFAASTSSIHPPFQPQKEGRAIALLPLSEQHCISKKTETAKNSCLMVTLFLWSILNTPKIIGCVNRIHSVSNPIYSWWFSIIQNTMFLKGVFPQTFTSWLFFGKKSSIQKDWGCFLFSSIFSLSTRYGDTVPKFSTPQNPTSPRFPYGNPPQWPSAVMKQSAVAKATRETSGKIHLRIAINKCHGNLIKGPISPKCHLLHQGFLLRRGVVFILHPYETNVYPNLSTSKSTYTRWNQYDPLKSLEINGYFYFVLVYWPFESQWLVFLLKKHDGFLDRGPTRKQTVQNGYVVVFPRRCCMKTRSNWAGLISSRVKLHPVFLCYEILREMIDSAKTLFSWMWKKLIQI